MFGSSKDSESAIDSSQVAEPLGTADRSSGDAIDAKQRKSSASASSASPSASGEGASPTGDKKRRSSGVSRARDMFSNARQSLHMSGSPNEKPMSAMQKLGKTDPALSVPQGSLNNSAGESVPSPRSTFRVGVTEDKNKKCRRTMEDTHAYLYNFLSTPAPALGSKADKRGSHSGSIGSVESNEIVETDNGYFAIFDGHAGNFAADWCGKKVHVLLEDIIRKHPNTPIPELLDMTFTTVDQQLERLPLKNSGCTAVTAVLRWEDRIPNSQSATGSTAIAPAAAAAVKAASESSLSSSKAGEDATAEAAAQAVGASSAAAMTDHEAKLRQAATRQRVLYTANVGDARIVLCRNGKALRLSYDHKGSDENEGKRVAGAGGLILNNRVNGVLAVTRALGDAYMKDLVTGHPYTTETVIQPDIDEFLILACDGLWDVCSDQDATDLIRNIQDPQEASRALVDHALARFSTDNLSCMVVRFDNHALQQTVDRKAEPIGVEGDPATQKGGVTETEAIIGRQKNLLRESDENLERIPSNIMEEDEQVEPGPELNPAALEAAKRDKKPSPPEDAIKAELAKQ